MQNIITVGLLIHITLSFMIHLACISIVYPVPNPVRNLQLEENPPPWSLFVSWQAPKDDSNNILQYTLYLLFVEDNSCVQQVDLVPEGNEVKYFFCTWIHGYLYCIVLVDSYSLFNMYKIAL